MRIVSYLVLWMTAFALAVTIFTYGHVKYYWYANNERRGYELRTWMGNSLDDDGGYDKGYTFRYNIYRFERNSEMRTILIILILAGASAATIVFQQTRVTHRAPSKFGVSSGVTRPAKPGPESPSGKD